MCADEKNCRVGGAGVVDVLEGLNEAQLDAVTTTEGNVRVIAGAGSGKTRALARRFAFLVNEAGVMPSNILCVTFTNKSANEMRQRIHNLTGDNDTGYVNTFHGFCVSVLQEDSHAISYPKSFLVLDNSDIDAMLGIIYEERGLTLRDMTFSAARDMIEVRKIVTEPDYYTALLDLSAEALRQRYLASQATGDIIFYGYLYQQRKCFGLDYNDLIKLTLAVFRREPEIADKWQRRLEYIMVDEFQDIDALQYELMDTLAAHHHNLFVVGDPDQTIYTWRGADVRFLLEFDLRHASTKTIVMTKNYRSTPQVLDVANSLVSKNTMRVEKDLEPTRAGGSRVLAHIARDAEAEGEWIARKCRELHASGTPWRDMCVLYRAHYVSRSVEEGLVRAEVPYTIYSGTQFFGRAEVRDALAYLRMVAYRDDLSFERVVNVPKRNIGEQRMRFLREFAQGKGISLFEALRRSLEDPLFRGTGAREFVALIDRHSTRSGAETVSELLRSLLDESGYERALRLAGSQERLDNLAELRQSVYEYETTCGEEATLERYLTHVALFSNVDAGTGADKVKLMTVHSAKGLEFPIVFLCGMNEGVFPSRKTSTLAGMEEERRLAFVAVTRAKDRLFLTQAEGRGLDGAPRYPSRFVLDVDPALFDYDEPPREGLIEEARAYIAGREAALRLAEQGPSFGVGQRVCHRVFGNGTIASVDESRGSYVIRFDELLTERSISFRVAMEAL